MKIVLRVVGIDNYVDYDSLDVLRKLYDFNNVTHVEHIDTDLYEVAGEDLGEIVGVMIPFTNSYLITSRVQDEKTGFEPTNWDIFEDRAKSLLERWSRFAKENPEKPVGDSIDGFLREIDDGYTKVLKNRES